MVNRVLRMCYKENKTKRVKKTERKVKSMLTSWREHDIIFIGFEETCAVDSRYPKGSKGACSACRGVKDMLKAHPLRLREGFLLLPNR